MNWSRVLLVAIALTLSGSCQAKHQSAAPSPSTEVAKAFQPTGWVTDQAELLSDVEEAALTAKLQELKRRTGHELAVVTVRSLDGQPIEQYSLALARRWGAGRRDYNDGVMLLIAPNERKVRIEVARGLHGVLTDAVSSSILVEKILPQFRAGQFASGIGDGVDAIIAVIDPDPGR